MSSYVKISAISLYSYLDKVLSPYQLTKEVERALKTHLVEANLCGMDSHGLQQIIGYVKSLQSGRINPQPRLRLNSERPTMIRIDADRSLGHYAGRVAMDTAIAAARQFGMAVVGVSNSNHFGMAGYYTRMAAEAGMIGFATSDTNAVDLAPYGGKKAKLGNNPISWGIPTGTPQPVILDIAAGIVIGSNFKHFVSQDLPLALDWGLTEAGEPTDDPKQVVVNLPACYKGSGLAFVADLLCGPLLNTAAAMFKDKTIHDAANGTGHLFWVLDVEAWTKREEFEQRVQSAIASLKDTPRLDPKQPIYYPGELEAITREERLLTGIPIPQALIDDLAVYFGEDCFSCFSKLGS
ncbi:MAG: Ldh family oxidoreductase [Iphinoe sp. HA4291-MV1]|jgi:LDH2 family malate/lactate/ureidoglycolate dehydrogenase|nr:Ldh family oxidoreductase [Iphinoe sp. HA4291-MV1]